MLTSSTRHLLIFASAVSILSHVCFARFSRTVYNITDCASSLSRCNQSSTGQWPRGTSDLVVRAMKNVINEPIFHLEWDAYVQNLRCFQIIIKSDGIPDSCKMLDYTIQSNNRSNHSLTFTNEDMSLTPSNRDYTIELYTLPQRNAKPMVLRRNFTVFRCYDWLVPYQYIYDGEQIVITFDKAPQRCNFRNYSVILKDENNKMIFEKIINEKENSSKLTAIFSGPLCKGKYYIVIEKATWGCWDFDGSYRTCTGSKSNLDTYIPRIPCERDRIRINETTSIRETNGRPTIIMMIICVLVIILSILLAVYFLNSLHLKPKKRGIILCVDDHSAHTEAVKRLVDYLRECHLDISLASQFLKHDEDNNQLTVLSEVLKSDFVLLVISSAFQERMEAWEKQQDYIEFFKEKNSHILNKQFLEKIICWNKLNICKFDHVTAFGPWFKCCYSLPSHLSVMVNDLETAGYNFSTFKYSRKKILLNWFRISVEKAADYERSNSEWFRQKYFCPRVIVTEDFGYTEHT